MTGTNHYVVCVDESEGGSKALEWVMSAGCIASPSDKLHIVHVLPPASFSAYPLATGLAAGASTAAFVHEHEAALKAATATANKLLHQSVEAAAEALKVRLTTCAGHLFQTGSP